MTPQRAILGVALGLSLCVSSCGTVSRPSAIDSTAASLGTALASAESAARGGLNTESNKQAYSRAIETIVAAWMARGGHESRNRPVDVEANGKRYRLTGMWPERMRFDELVAARTIEERRLSKPVLRDGVGAPFVARWHFSQERKKSEPFLPEAGYLMAVTVTVDFRGGAVTLRVHEARSEDMAVVAGCKYPLAADFSAVSELILLYSKEKKVPMPGLAALRNSEKYMDKLGLLSLEPPARDRIPVVFVHGLMSNPLTWHNAFNELNGDPVIRRNYQIYFFRYPTGVPVIYSSGKFRQQLGLLHEEMRRVGNHASAHHMVLIGHSMGGLVSKLQLTSSGDRFWVNILGAEPKDLGLTKQELAAFRQYLEFNPNPHVDRVVFVCTPHRGSKMAEGIVGAVGRSLVRLPLRIVGATLSTTFDVLSVTRDNDSVQRLIKKGVPSSIDNLSPRSRFVRESTQLPLKPGLHVHSIIGNKDGRPLNDPKCSDGVVPYTSAHLDGVDSELVVNSNHGAHETAEGIAELRRILLLHLAALN